MTHATESAAGARARQRRVLLEELAELRALKARLAPRRTRRMRGHAALLRTLHRL